MNFEKKIANYKTYLNSILLMQKILKKLKNKNLIVKNT